MCSESVNFSSERLNKHFLYLLVVKGNRMKDKLLALPELVRPAREATMQFDFNEWIT